MDPLVQKILLENQLAMMLALTTLWHDLDRVKEEDAYGKLCFHIGRTEELLRNLPDVQAGK